MGKQTAQIKEVYSACLYTQKSIVQGGWPLRAFFTKFLLNIGLI